jgi:hypothetical protein
MATSQQQSNGNANSSSTRLSHSNAKTTASRPTPRSTKKKGESSQAATAKQKERELQLTLAALNSHQRGVVINEQRSQPDEQPEQPNSPTGKGKRPKYNVKKIRQDKPHTGDSDNQLVTTPKRKQAATATVRGNTQPDAQAQTSLAAESEEDVAARVIRRRMPATRRFVHFAQSVITSEPQHGETSVQPVNTRPEPPQQTPLAQSEAIQPCAAQTAEMVSSLHDETGTETASQHRQLDVQLQRAAGMLSKNSDEGIQHPKSATTLDATLVDDETLQPGEGVVTRGEIATKLWGESLTEQEKMPSLCALLQIPCRCPPADGNRRGQHYNCDTDS